MITLVPKPKGWYQCSGEKLSHLVRPNNFGVDSPPTFFYCGKVNTATAILNDTCPNKCWRCIEAYEQQYVSVFVCPTCEEEKPLQLRTANGECRVCRGRYS